MIDLQPFCSTDPARPSLHKPFSRPDGFVYATDGHIAVRVDGHEFEAYSGETKAERIFAEWKIDEPLDMMPLRLKEPLPAPPEKECEPCAGTGREHAVCPDCTCDCPTCDGTGNAPELAYVAISGLTIAAKYVRLMLALPMIRVERGPVANKVAPLRFAFTGGVGLIMPLDPRGRDYEQLGEQIMEDHDAR